MSLGWLTLQLYTSMTSRERRGTLGIQGTAAAYATRSSGVLSQCGHLALYSRAVQLLEALENPAEPNRFMDVFRK